MSTIIVYKIKKRLVKSGKDKASNTTKIPQLGNNFFPTGERFFPNWGKIIAQVVSPGIEPGSKV